MRPIDADALKDKVNSLINDSPIEKEDEFWNWAVKLCVEEIDKAPAVFDCRGCKNNGNERECVDCHDYSNFVKYEERPTGDLANKVWALYEKHHSHLATHVIEFGDELQELLGKYQKGSDKHG